jgi:hypothetical protein
MNFKRVLKNYTDGLWGKDLVKRAYQAGIITKEEYNYIIAQPRKGEPDKPIPSPYRGQNNA